MARVLISGGRVIDPASGVDTVQDIAIEDDRIVEIGVKLAKSPADRIIDATGKLVVPGLIDPHVHLREPGAEHKETIESGTLAAAVGGFTTVCCMPNTTPALDTPEMVTFVDGRSRSTAHCRVYTVAAGTKGRRGEEPSEISLLARAGAVGISDDGDAIASAGVMARVLTMTKQVGLAFMQHCQDPTLTVGASMHAGEVSVRLGLGGWPRVAEELIIERDVRLNTSIGCRYHVQHLSSSGSVEIVRRARAAGQPVTAEASPHHLLLTHEAVGGADGFAYDTNAKMNPPLREASDIAAIKAGIADGTITVLATDHAPHSVEEKARPFEEAPFGIVGLETALPLYVESLVKTGVIDWPRLIAMMTVEPAKLCGLHRIGLGTLAMGGTADVTVIDPEQEWTIRLEDLAGKSRNTPFLGRRVGARVVLTMVGGQIRHERR
ncbi:MAG: dihydroorotase [Phycisphaeraceae bacterium]|nr:dihydroorotase [Phycisphaeraceae bacterium]